MQLVVVSSAREAWLEKHVSVVIGSRPLTYRRHESGLALLVDGALSQARRTCLLGLFVPGDAGQALAFNQR